MSGTMTIGRVGRDASLPLSVPESGRWSGDTLSLSGTLGSELGDKTKGRVLRDQFHGLADRVGRVLPVTFSDTPELDGWYRLGRPSISSTVGSFATGVFNMSIDLERVTRSANVLQELRMLGAVRTNSHSFTTVARGWYSPGVRPLALSDGAANPDPYTRQTRTGSEGPVVVVVDSAQQLFDATARWYVSPADYYAGACSVTRLVAGTYYTVVGDHIPAGSEGTFAISNTLVSVLGSTTAGKAEFSMLWHDGTAWESFKTYRITGAGGGEYGYGPVLLQIVRNDVNVVAVRLFFGQSATPAEQAWLDMTIRRGARHVEFRWHSATRSDDWGVQPTTANAGTAHTSGLHAASADASGNKWILTTPRAVTADTVNGRIWLSVTAANFPFMIGAEMAGAGGGFDVFTSQVYQYFGAVSTAQRPVVS